VVVDPQGPPHLLPEIFNLDRFQGCLDELEYLGQYALLPVLQQLVLLNLRRL
jgi:hypothetical protein